MSDSAYQGSQAYNQGFIVNEFVNRNTGSLTLSTSLVSLRGITPAVGLTVNLSYGAGGTGLLGLPAGWSFGIAFVVPGASLTTQGKTYVIDLDWSDEAGHRSGLRYVNNHGMKFEPVIPPQNLPSGRPGTYAYRLTYVDGARDYFDIKGKLVEHGDVFGNAISYVYTDAFGSVFNNRLDRIVDSFGQTVRFGYGSNAITIATPDGARTTINASARGVESIVDPLGNTTIFSYMSFVGRTVIAEIRYPTGLRTQLTYLGIPYLAEGGAQRSLPAVSDLYHADPEGKILDHTGYAFGADSGGNTYTGFSAGYRMSGGRDSLMDSNNGLYVYDVLVKRLDTAGKLLAASRVYYNYLHLPTREEHYLVDAAGAVRDGFRALHTYRIDPNLHARTANFDKPVVTEQFVHCQGSVAWLPLRKATQSYDHFGEILASEEWAYDRQSQCYVSQIRSSVTYALAAWGGELPIDEVYTDSITGFQRRVAYALTADRKSIEAAKTSYRSKAEGDWIAWKTKTYTYDSNGRTLSETLAWSGAGSGGVTSTTTTNAYAYDAASHRLTVTNTNAVGESTVSVFDVGGPTGPLVAFTTPLGETITHVYDPLGRLVKTTDADGLSTTVTYSTFATAGANTTSTTGPTGYLVERRYDALGRQAQVLDNGDPTKPFGAAPNRCLSQAKYNALGRAMEAVNELGLSTHFAYDALGRLVATTDPLGNVSTVDYDDASLTQSSRMNGELRAVTRVDSLGRTVSVATYPDSADASVTFFLLAETAYDGSGNVLRSTVSQAPLEGGRPVELHRAELTYDVESRVVARTYVGHDGLQVSTTKSTTYDLLGNAIASTRTTRYADGRRFENTGCVSAHDGAGRLTSITNQLKQVESYTYDRNGRLQARTRFDGTVFTYDYDKTGKLLRTAWSDGSISNTYWPNGRIRSVSSEGGTIQYDYHPDGSAKSVTYPDGRSQSYEVDSYSRIVRHRDPSGACTANEFDAFGRLSARRHGGDTIEFVYGTVNRTKGVLTSDTLANAWQRQYAYDGFGRIKAVVTVDDKGQATLKASYSRDAAGRLTTAVLASDACRDRAVNLTKHFEYDGLNQLVEARTEFRDGGRPSRTTYRYDGNGNVLSRADDGVVEDFCYNAIDQLALPGLAYDLNGRLVSDKANGRHYTYSALDRLLRVTTAGNETVDFTYHPDGALRSVTSGKDAHRVYYSGGAANAIATVADGSRPERWTSFLLGGGERLAAYEAGAPALYYATSRQSTSLVQEAASGAHTALEYDDFGAPANAVRLDANKSFTWNQEFTEPASGLVYLRSRFYNPALMRFMTMDSLANDNRYGYCSGDPVNLVDPTGHDAQIAGLVVGAIVGIVATVATGGAAGFAAAAIFGPECIAASISVGAISGAAGAVAGDATSAAINREPFTPKRALVDAVSGAVGGAVGAGVGGAAGRAAMRLALSGELSPTAISRIGIVCSGAAGGLAGSAAASAVTSVAYGQTFFSGSTAISMAVGVAAGIGGGLLTSGAFLSVTAAALGVDKVIPVPLTESELGLIVPAENNVGFNSPNELLVMAPQEEANQAANKFAGLGTGYRRAQRLYYGTDEETYDTIAAHGAGNTIFASVSHGDPLLGAPNYVRPIKGSLFARYLAQQGWDDPGRGPIKLMTCFGAWSNAQTIANALGRDVYAGYSNIDRYTFTNWKLFRPQ